jgi:hypothetical protein
MYKSEINENLENLRILQRDVTVKCDGENAR